MRVTDPQPICAESDIQAARAAGRAWADTVHSGQGAPDVATWPHAEAEAAPHLPDGLPTQDPRGTALKTLVWELHGAAVDEWATLRAGG